MAIKLDISKSYDKLEWTFLEAMMLKLGFDEVWISRIMTCVTNISYFVRINGQPCSMIRPSRGLHQGDPIFLYRYLIFAEGLSSLLNEAEKAHKIWGVKVARNSPSINYLYFVDGSIAFDRAKIKECKRSKRFLIPTRQSLVKG